MGAIDSTIIILWCLGILGVGIWAGLRSSLEGFWANRRQTSTARLVFTIVATQVGGGTIIGIASAAYTSGTGYGLIAIISTVTGFLAVAKLAPWAKRFGDRVHAYTLPEVFGKRYGRTCQVVAGVVVGVAYLSLLGGQFLSLSVILKAWTGVSLDVALALAAGGVIVYSAFAGLRGDIVTDVAHFWAMVIVLFLLILPAVCLQEPVGSHLANVEARLWSPATFGGWTYVIAGIAFGALVPVVSMEMWMRVYAAHDGAAARKSFIISAMLVVPFYLLPLFLGLVSTQVDLDVEMADQVLVQTMLRYLPTGLLGLGVAALFAVVVSTANTLIVVLGAVLYRDILGRTGGVEMAEMRISRAVTFIVGVLGTGFVLLVPSVVQLVLNAFFVILTMAPPLIGLAIWKRATRKGALVALLAGPATTLVLLSSLPQLAFLPGLFASSMCFFGISLMTKHDDVEDLEM